MNRENGLNWSKLQTTRKLCRASQLSQSSGVIYAAAKNLNIDKWERVFDWTKSTPCVAAPTLFGLTTQVDSDSLEVSIMTGDAPSH